MNTVATTSQTNAVQISEIVAQLLELNAVSTSKLQELIQKSQERDNNPSLTPVAMKALRAEISALDGDYQVNENNKKRLKSLLNSLQNHQDASSSTKETQKQALLMKDLMPFTNSVDPKVFWIKFETACKTKMVSGAAVPIALFSLIQTRTLGADGPAWFSAKILPIQGSISMSELKMLFLKAFLDLDWDHSHYQKAINIAYRRSETVKEFTARFTNQLTLIDIILDQTGPEGDFWKNHLVYKCPDSVK